MSLRPSSLPPAIACILLVFLSVACVDAAQKTCTQSEEKQALNESDHLNDWNALHRSFIRFAHCDDGAIAEGYSDSVGKILAHDWKELEGLAKLGEHDKKFEEFVLRHIDGTLATDELTVIASNAQGRCPTRQSKLCGQILRRANLAAAP